VAGTIDARRAMVIHAGHILSHPSQWGGDTSSAVSLVALAGVYALGTRRVWSHAGQGRGVRRRDIASFIGALAALSLAMLSPIDALSGVLFSAHMTQHVLLAVVAPPLLVLGAPAVALLWALPASARPTVVRTLRHPGIASVWRAISNPFVACAVHAGALWVWHAPRLYVSALDDGFVHALEHASFVATAGLLWWSILHARQPRRAAYAAGILVLFLTALQSAALGALLTFSGAPWFPAQDIGAVSFGLTPLQDQQLAGLIMWVPGGLLYTAAMGILFAGWMRQLDRASPSRTMVASRSLLSGTSS